MSQLRTSMVDRVNAVTAAKTTYHLQPFAWARNDCATLFCAVMRNMGHQVSHKPLGRYRSLAEGKQALKNLGCDTVVDWVDKVATLERTTWARCIVGDAVALPGGDDADGWPGLAVCVGNGRLMGFHGGAIDQACVIFAPAFVPLVCWRPASLS